ncbi:outer membrane beta-barrel protein [uncultured Fibrobacter sp.]|uniref:outer membrane beta-barrel protein n=1 Tax=uncultured Fibrobacter sp. TaxID=261512 RepID=UPI0026074AB6|nr:outer membrane beta-barrel protein [uncultured Fibrobacter sp.]
MINRISVKIALAVFVLAGLCHAGDASNRFFRLGTSIGLSYDFLIGKEGNLMDPKDFSGPGFLLAINTIFNFHDLPALRTGLTYNVRSLENNVGFADENLNRDTYVHYEAVSFGIPVLAHFQTQSRIYFDAGLTFAYTIKATEGYSRRKNSTYGFKTKWDGEGLSFCDIQLTAGTGIMLGNRFELGLQSLFGLTTVLDASEINEQYDNISVHLLSFSVALGFYFI